MDIIELSLTVNQVNSQLKAHEILCKNSGLSQKQIKDAMQKGAVWLQRGKSKKRFRRASKPLKFDDKLVLNYNAKLLSISAEKPELIFDAEHYSVWYKPYGLNCQGSRWCDHLSINRWVEMNFHQITGGIERPAFLVHRLDRATSGLILLCHSKNAARIFSEMFSSRQMDKRYQAIVHGDLSTLPDECQLNQDIDDKRALSVLSFAEKKESFSLVNIQLLTGRKHQIRKHLSGLGNPIVGDRLYGLDNEQYNRDLQLQSVSLGFICPFSNEKQQFFVKKSHLLKL
ncbi:RluA family pseudouridine synthase [Parashewanella spongiae]|uniref:RluA family pseudouridine synthase n=1 Tax=Parashewanella spongiae TaxID=342950 RepID=A0A3A6TJ22_9GAMM|nr:RluA family pseudouridine synthase [Parashewanella spongiae]MCL1079705.1 RluA family pseudouridine synthase [Parashewanella spongiae]RJY07173.1 RluA family pseudouridine synthase [Parashewanella spongiae]